MISNTHRPNGRNKSLARIALRMLNSEPPTTNAPVAGTEPLRRLAPARSAPVASQGLQPLALATAMASAARLQPDAVLAPEVVDEVFRAVMLRLTATVDPRHPQRNLAKAADAAERVRADVQECVAALQQLRTTVLQELVKRRG